MKHFLILLFILVFTQVEAQKFITSDSYVKFFSSAPLEDIEAENKTARSVIDLSTGELAYSVVIKDFEFEKSLMQEHFNENYLESEKYPNSTLKAKIVDWSGMKGKQEVTVKGELNIHGITNEVEIPGTIDYQDDKVLVEAKFPVQLKDYKVKIPKAVFYNIAEEVEVTVKFEYSPYTSN